MPNLTQIEKHAMAYAVAREHLASIVSAMNQGIEAIKRDHMKRLKKAVAEAAERHDALKALIEAAPDCFIKPRSMVLHGIKLGYQKGKGKIEWDDADQVVRLIKRHFPEQADVLIATSERPAKDALAQLTAAELKKLGISVTDGGDAVFIKPADSAVDKMVDALLKDAVEEVA
ncbi:host-nuclease inhibitor Gam family protein [Azonexus sp.]|uniref:host-nuclease inhibitor Gam family protein n=1 Tax=Azonexus sp. TaxID=1872668 RepID=UPI0035B0E7D6